MITFLKGDTTATITLALAEGFDYSNKTVCLEYQGVQLTFSSPIAGGSLIFCFTARETASMSLGSFPVRVWLEDENGNVTTIHNADVKMRVTDCIADVHSGGAIYLDVRGGLSGIDGLPERYTDEDLHNKINEILRRLGGTVATLLLCALPAFGASLTLHTAPKGVIYNDQQLVTNATLDVSDLVTTGQLATAVGAIPAPDFTVSNDTLVATIEAKAPAPDFSTSNETLVATIEATAPTPTAEEIGAVAKDFVAEEYDPGKDYKIGDVVRIDGRFYVFIDDWYHQWGGSPIDYEAAVELSDLGEVIKYRNARDFLTLGDGGTNSPSFKRILTGWDNDKPCYFTIETTGWIIDGPYPNKIRLVNQELRVTTNNWDSFWSLRLPEVLQKENVAPMSNEYFSEEFKKSPTSPWHVYSYLTNNYTRTADMAVTYLTKGEASSTYISEAAADSKYSTPAGIASAISSALDNFRPQYLYNKDGNYRLDVNGKVQRQTHNGYNVNWTNESTGVVFVYSNPDSWTCNHPTLGAIHFTRSDGVMYCNEYPPVRATEDYPNTTVLSFGAPIGTMRAIPNAAGSILWNDCKQFADAASVPTKPEDIGAASPGTVSNIVTKAYVEGLGISSEETDPTIGLTNGTIYVKGSTITPLTSHQSLSGYVPTSRTVNSKPLSSNVNLDASDVGAYSSADGTSLANIVNSWEGYWDGTNVIFEVTNYYGNTSGEIPRLRIKELREGAWQTVWDEANKFQVCETNIMSNVVAYVTGEVDGVKDYASGNFAPMAWGTVTDKGSTNVVGNSVWMTAPETYFAGGTEYQRVAVGSGMICVLTDNGALAKTTGEPGTFRFQDEGGTNYFGFAKSDSYTIGCNTDGIVVDGTLVTLRYDVIMGGGDVPIVYWRQSLTSGEWVQLNNADGTATQGAPYTVTWYTSGGSYYAAINCGANASGFFKAETSVAGNVVFETNMKMRIDGGLSCTNTSTGVMGVIRPTYNGSTVIWNWSAK